MKLPQVTMPDGFVYLDLGTESVIPLDPPPMIDKPVAGFLVDDAGEVLAVYLHRIVRVGSDDRIGAANIASECIAACTSIEAASAADRLLSGEIAYEMWRERQPWYGR